MPKKRKSRKPLLPAAQSPTMLASDSPPDPNPDPNPLSQPDPLHVPEQLQDPPVPAADPVDPSSDISTVAAASPIVPELSVPAVHVATRKGPVCVGGGGKRKKGAMSKKRLAEIEEKLAALSANFNPVSFSSKSAADVTAHEHLFRSLGLWDFAHLPLDGEIRSDLLVLLIAHYDPPNRRSTVHGRRITVSRADLARALSLPVKKDKSAPPLDSPEQQLFSSDDSVRVITEFMMRSIFLLDDEAMIMPMEFISASQLVKEGQPHKIDWAGLLWNLVERDLMEAPKNGLCCYASHLQCLLKHQRPELFLEEVKDDQELEPEVEVEAEGEQSVEVAPVEDDDDAGDELQVKNLDEIQGVGVDSMHGASLSLGLGVDADMMDVIEECKADEENKQWIPEEKNQRMVLRSCNMNNTDVGSMECDDSIKDDGGVKAAVREEGTYDDDVAAKFSLERFTSTDLLSAMDAVTDPYGPMPHQVGPSSGEFLNMRHDMQKNVVLDPEMGGSFMYRNDGKRGLSDMEEDDDAGMEQFAQENHQPKRIRSDGQWEFAVSSISGCMENVKREFGMCMENVSREVSKAQIICAEKDNELANIHLQIQYLNTMIQEKDRYIQSLEKERFEEKQRKEAESCRVNHELRLLGRLVVGYRRALKETRAAFTEYRKKFPQGDEPLYKDVPGGGGLVLSTRELERLRLHKDQELRQVAIDLVSIFEEEWCSIFNRHNELLSGLNKRLEELDQQFQHLKETAEKLRVGVGKAEAT